MSPSPPEKAHERRVSARGPASTPAAVDAAVDGLLRDLGSRLRRGALSTPTGTGAGAGAPAEAEPSARLASGIPAIDRMLGGGFPPARLSEIAGPASSGRTSVALSLIAHTTRGGAIAAVVDSADAFDPASAEAAGALLSRVLWARPPGWREAVRCSERLLEARGFACVLLDGAGGDVPSAAWQRLARAATASGTALLVLSRERVTGSFADLALEMQPPRPRFRGTPALLEGLEIEAVVVRHRTGPSQRSVSVRLGSRAA